MRKCKTSAFAQRALEWYARNVAPQTALKAVRLDFEIHAGSGACVCAQCESARKVLDQIGRAGQR